MIDLDGGSTLVRLVGLAEIEDDGRLRDLMRPDEGSPKLPIGRSSHDWLGQATSDVHSLSQEGPTSKCLGTQYRNGKERSGAD